VSGSPLERICEPSRREKVRKSETERERERERERNGQDSSVWLTKRIINIEFLLSVPYSAGNYIEYLVFSIDERISGRLHISKLSLIQH